MTSIKDRILQVPKIQSIKNEDFFKKINSSYSNFRGKSKISSPSADVLVEISTNFPNINIDWILTGKGEALNERDQDYNLVEKKGVPYFDVDFTASFLEVENNQQAQPDSYVTHPFFKDCELVVRASGQSMSKVIKHGDAIGLIKIEDWRDFLPMGEIYALVTVNNFRMIKIITKGQNDDSFTLISKPTFAKKDEFPSQEINKNKILSVYKVQASAHLF
jgi:hypothetical protein